MVLCAMLMAANLSVGQEAPKVHVGQPAPDFTVPSLDGKTTYRLSDFRGHRVLIFNWASW
jgi:hypothetical protein